MNRFAYIRPLREDNTSADDLEFWVTRRGLGFYAFLVDDAGEYDGEHFATYAEARADLEQTAASMGWDWSAVHFSVDE